MEAIKEAMAKKAATSSAFSAGTAAGPDVTKQINDLNTEVGAIHSQLADVVKMIKNGARGGGPNKNNTTDLSATMEQT